MTRRLIATLTLALCALFPATAGASLPAGFIGISPQHPSNPNDYRLMREAGVTNVRLSLFWAVIQAQSPKVAAPDWSSFDRDVAMAAEEGIQVFPLLVDSPEWVASDQHVLPVRNAFQRRAWANFVRRSARRYGPGGTFWKQRPELPYLPIRKWEIWNEMNIVTFMKDPDPARYARLVRIAGRILHREDPGSKVILGGLFGRPLQVPPNVALGDFLRRFYKSGNVKRHFDGVGLHPYVADVRAMAGQLTTMPLL